MMVSDTLFVVTPESDLLLLVVELAKEGLTVCPNNSAHKASNELKIEFMMIDQEVLGL